MTDAISKIEEYSKFGSVLGLERIGKLLEELGNPQDELKVIHVAGTNGKGSVCRYIYEVLEANGYRTGIFTSPYVEDFEERIEFNHDLISSTDLESFTDKVLSKVEKTVSEGFESPTEFEIITAVALCYFASKKPDFVILEVGLGGRGDSTNIIKKPIISVITSIGYDHMDRLGDTLEKIAWEKAGIIKPGVPLVMNVEEHEPAAVIARTCYKNKSVLYDVTKYRWKKIGNAGLGNHFNATVDFTEYRDIVIRMAGDHQIENAVTALSTIEIMRKSGIIEVNRDRLGYGMAKAFQKGRFEPLENGKYILDGAHNAPGWEALVKTVDDYFYGKNILTVIGVLADKDVERIVDFASYIGETFIVSEPQNDRRMYAGDLAAKLADKGKKCYIEPSPKGALKKARELEQNFDVVLCAGSMYLIGEFRRLLNYDNRKTREGSSFL